jgi:hypothetical protein
VGSHGNHKNPVAVAEEEEQEPEQEPQQQPEQEQQEELEPGGVAEAELGDGGRTPSSKRGEELMSSPPGDEPSSPAVQQLQRFQLVEHLCVKYRRSHAAKWAVLSLPVVFTLTLPS